MAKFITVTANPAVDCTFTVPRFSAGEVNRSDKPGEISAGGKGVNVARVLATLCEERDEVVAIGCAGGEAGRRLQHLLDAERIPHEFADISPVETRQAIIIVDTSNEQQTVVNEPGALLGASAFPELKDILKRQVREGDGVLFCGSLPPGFAVDAYADLIDDAKTRGAANILLDSSGDALKRGVQAGPGILKVNQSEFAKLKLDLGLPNSITVLEARELLDLDVLAVTLGKGGAMMAMRGDGLWAAEMPPMDIVSAVGSGDAFSAGLIYSLTKFPHDSEAALRLACACGGANGLSIGAGQCSLEQIESVSGKILVKRVE